MISTFAFHIEVTPLANGTYELIQEPDGDFSEAQVNTVEITKVPNFDSEEPQHAIYRYYFTCAFKLLEFIENPSCIILGTY